MRKRPKYFWLFETLTNQHWTTDFSFFHPSLSQISICLSRSSQLLIWHMTSCPRGSFSYSSSCYKHSEFRRLMKAFTKKNKIKWSFHTMHIKISRSLLYTSDQRQSCEQELPHWTFKVQFLSISSRVLFPSKNTRGNKDEIMMKEGWFFPPKSHVYENISISLLWWFLTLSPRSQMQSPFSLKLLFFRNRTNKTTYMDFKLPAAHCLISKDFCERYC